MSKGRVTDDAPRAVNKGPVAPGRLWGNAIAARMDYSQMRVLTWRVRANEQSQKILPPLADITDCWDAVLPGTASSF